MAPTVGTAASLAGAKGQGRGQGQTPALPMAFEGRRQVAASNSTLNAWVGGRQPSWLANATPVQPTPRPAQSPPTPYPIAATPLTDMPALSQPQPEPQPQSQLQPQPPSRSPPRPQPESPSPSQSQSQVQLLGQSLCQSEHTLQPRLQSPAQPIPPHPPHPPLTVTASDPPRFATSLADSVLPSPASSDEPSPCLSFPRESHRHSPNAGNLYPVRARHDPPTTEAHFVLDSHVNSRPLSSPQSRDTMSPVHNDRGPSPQHTNQVQPHPAISSAVDTAITTPPTSAVAGNFNTGTVSQDILRSIAPKRRRVENNSLAFLDSLGVQSTMQSYLQEIGGEASLDAAVEQPRFLLLRKACREGDVFFVALHQLFCSWTMSQASIHKLCHENVHDTSLVDNAFGIMGTVLKANSKQREPVLRWFANFPVPLATMRLHEFYARTINQVLDFLICVSKKWSIINHAHASLGYPLLMKELINNFRLYSPILQSIVFRASRRTLGAPDHPIGLQLDDLFWADQEKHRNPNDGTYSLRLEGENYDQYNDVLARRYQALISRFRAASQGHPNHSPSITPTPSTAQSPNVPSASIVSDQQGPQSQMAPRIRTAPSPINTGRVIPNNQSFPSPSPTYPPTTLLHSTAIPNTDATFAPQFAVATSHILPSSPTVRMTMPPYQSPNLTQQGQPGTFGAHSQSGIHQREYEQQSARQQQFQQQFQQQRLQQQQQQQLLQQQQYEWQAVQQQLRLQQIQQNIQQPQYIQRKRAQPGATPSPRPSSVQITHSLTSQMPPVERLSPRFQNISNLSAPIAPPHNLASVSSAVHMTHQSGLTNSLPGSVNVVQPSSVRPRPSAGPQRQSTQIIDRLIPPPGLRINLQDYPHTPYEKRSIDHSLHQAHLRSPKRIPRMHSGATSNERYYQAVKDFVLKPSPIPPQPYLYEFTFNVVDTVLTKLTLDERSGGEVLPINRFRDGSLRIRARCCNMASGPVLDHVWVTSETTWPDHVFMTLNEQVIEIKRKQHHSKDIPVDISSFIHMGPNTLSISVFPRSTQHKQHTPYIAVEIVEVLSHSAILRMVNVSGIKQENETREVIRRRLTGSSLAPGGEDNDIEIPDGISIDLADPFTATIYKVPVRGQTCTHLECFDLENWLNTRLGKKSPCVCGGGPNCRCPKEPSFVDKWKCPLCNGDARPYSLRIDEFLVEIRAHLEQNNHLRTKSITVFADGSWKANDPAGDGDSDMDSDDNGPPATSKATSKPSAPRNIIELDDD
ncbi:putative MIZ SP-RING zinc finger [Rosellinia necatrix]|uniref:Putative MIZ SP-RING zinc finger n=1 Tax=Rosellinia necatrix TaxID=77044 RepID=A0A1S7UMD7_ROSNE|nr:putative MIZ SP-RING zinc finger [Rosellinia necatrix]